MYYTKYALTKGIMIVECQDIHANYYEIKDKRIHANIISKKYAFEKLEDAIKDMEEQKLKKIKSLQSQIEKLRNTTFDTDLLKLIKTAK